MYNHFHLSCGCTTVATEQTNSLHTGTILYAEDTLGPTDSRQ